MHAVTYQAAMMLQPSTSDTPHTVYLAQVVMCQLVLVLLHSTQPLSC